jgi:FKBP-type peptidyl-prolyl cis-trans isomerase FkpA/FKBP-type peptidyl-prolyl cis-trans isomerase FklB
MRRSLLAFLYPLSVLGLVMVGAPARAADPELATDEQKTFYALGLMLSRSLVTFNLSAAELEVVQAGLADGVLNREKKLDPTAFNSKIQALQQSRIAVAAGEQKKAGEAFAARAAGEKGARKTESGLVYTETAAGTGEAPMATDKVKVHYTGKLVDGTVFDSSVQRGTPASFSLNGVIKCWTEGLQLMKVGGKGNLVCPSGIAYGDQGRPPAIPPGATLVFDVELLEIEK